MALLTRRRLLLAGTLVALLLIAGGVLFLAVGEDLKARSGRISVGISREQVEDILGPPVLVLQRTGGRGELRCWVDQLWQVDVRTGPDGRVESVDCIPSQSFVRGTLGRFVPLPK